MLTLLFLVVPFQAKAQRLKVKVIDSGYIFNNPPFKSCHASTIVELSNHELMAAWFGGYHEGSPNVCIWVSIKEHNGWTTPPKVADGVQGDGKHYPC